jgi:hypothetical protein
MNEVIGRGEKRVEFILDTLFGADKIMRQVPISSVISPEDYDDLGKEHNKHKFDLAILGNPTYIIEVNYKHGKIAHEKWAVYKLLIEKNPHFKTITIDDSECESLFSLDKNGRHEDTWVDWMDVIRALDMGGVETV